MLFEVYGFFIIFGGIGAERLFQSAVSKQSSDHENARAPFAVVELFTSEGCSSCPPAEKYLNELVTEAREQNQRIYPLAFHVDYWNHLGWKDEYSDTRFSERQRDYARRADAGRIYTPQMIVNGEVAFVGSDRQQGEAIIAQALQRAAVCVLTLQAQGDEQNGNITVAFQISPVPGQGVLQVALIERGLLREIRSGENSGRVLHHDNVVRAFETVELRNLSQGELVLRIPATLVLANSAVIAYVQDSTTNRILDATQVEF